VHVPVVCVANFWESGQPNNNNNNRPKKYTTVIFRFSSMMGSKVKASFRQQQINLVVAKALFFSTAMSSVGWQRFQNNFYLDKGFTSYEIGTLKSFGLLFKFVGEPFWCFVADLTDPKIVFILSILTSIVSMELLRLANPLTYGRVLFVKAIRTVTAPAATLTTAASFKLTEGTNEGYGRQRMFGSLAWGSGAFISGILIDAFGMTALFMYTYFFIAVNFVCVMYGMPSPTHEQTPTLSLLMTSDNHGHTSPPTPGQLKKEGGGQHTQNLSLLLHVSDSDSESTHSGTSRTSGGNNNNSTSIENGHHLHSGHGPHTHSSHGSGNGSASSVSVGSYHRHVPASPHVQPLAAVVASHVPTPTHQHASASHVYPHPPPPGSFTAKLNSFLSCITMSMCKISGSLSTYFADMRSFFSVATSRILLVNTFIYGLTMTIIDTFMYVSVEKDFGASRTFSGACTAASIISCLPVFYYSEYLLVRYGHFKLILVAEWACVVRLLLLSMLNPKRAFSQYFLLCIQLIHGLNFALFWSAAVDALFKLSPPGLTSSCLSTLNVMYFTLSGSAGNLLWGYVYNTLESLSVVYFLGAALLSCMLLVFQLYEFTVDVPSPRKDSNDYGSSSESNAGSWSLDTPTGRSTKHQQSIV
jgi:predicted MFS family arabinose efflux permease